MISGRRVRLIVQRWGEFVQQLSWGSYMSRGVVIRPNVFVSFIVL